MTDKELSSNSYQLGNCIKCGNPQQDPTTEHFVAATASDGVSPPEDSRPQRVEAPHTTATITLRREVQAFAEAMESKLRKNDYKQHWSHMGMQYLSMRLTQEREELRKAVEIGDPDEVLQEAADVANFAMMIADVIRRNNEWRKK